MVIAEQSRLVEVRRIDNRGRGGRGVFATEAIPKGTLIERVPVLLIPKNQVFGGETEYTRHNVLISWYVFDRDGVTKRDYVGLALGYGSLYNHSYTPNAAYTHLAPDLMEFHAIQDIAAGEEILINYGGKAEEKPDVHFDVH